MNTRLLMMTSAMAMGIVGLICSFLTDEIVHVLGLQKEIYFPLFLQVLGSLYLGFAALNWMAKGNLIGGIYSKPVALGNFTHFMISSIVLLKLFSNHTEMRLLIIPIAAYVTFALCFGKVAFTHPNIKKTTAA